MTEPKLSEEAEKLFDDLAICINYSGGNASRKAVSCLMAYVSKLEAELGWRPMETAPKNKIIMLRRPTAWEWGRVTPGKFNSDEYAKKPRPYWEMWLKIGSVTESRLWEPDGWMPLPRIDSIQANRARA